MIYLGLGRWIVKRVCGVCAGSGKAGCDRWRNPKVCPHCNGDGKARRRPAIGDRR